MLMYIPSLIRSIVLYGKKIKIMHVGLIEIANSVFVLVVGSYFTLKSNHPQMVAFNFIY